MLPTLDLFSGIGGLTHALRDVARPVGYCDNSKEAAAVLKRLMDENKIPLAPIYDDVRTLDGVKAFEGVHGPKMIVGGFPCTAISSSGKQEGLAHAGTGLFYEIIRLVRETSPAFVFLENVAAITETRQRGKTVLDDVVAEFGKLGYDMRWGCFRGFHVGAPLNRHRWFCLCYKNTSPARIDFKPFDRFDWALPKNPHMVPKEKKVRTRMSLLGNSVIPDAVNFAFRSLWTGMSLSVESTFALSGTVEFSRQVTLGERRDKTGGRTRFGEARGGTITNLKPPEWLPKIPNMRIELISSAFHPPPGYVHHRKEIRSITLPLWPAPRYSNGCRGNRVLTYRSRGDLGSAVRFHATTTGPRDGYTCPAFTEHLMGFPNGWTDA